MMPVINRQAFAPFSPANTRLFSFALPFSNSNFQIEKDNQ